MHIPRPDQLADIDVCLSDEPRATFVRFCGTGKSLIMYHAFASPSPNDGFNILIVPSISLVNQFINDYCLPETSTIQYVIGVCSQSEIDDEYTPMCQTKITTDPIILSKWLDDMVLHTTHPKTTSTPLIVSTYKSLETLIKVWKPDTYQCHLFICDEAHHITEDINKHTIFIDVPETFSPQKTRFFTATPINRNGVYMNPEFCDYDSEDDIYDNEDSSDDSDMEEEEYTTGPIVSRFSFYDALHTIQNEANQLTVCKDFDVSVSLYGDQNPDGLYEQLFYNIFQTRNSRVMIFFEDVRNGVNGFVKSKKKIQTAFERVKTQLHGVDIPYQWTDVKIKSVDANTKNRRKILSEFDKTPDHKIYLLASCATIGEGVDTKHANMCVFTSASSSYVRTIQRIGRITRSGERKGTLVLPISLPVDELHALESISDPETRQRETHSWLCKGFSKSGKFALIVNVLGALRHSDPYLFDLCMKFPNHFSRDELKECYQEQNIEFSSVTHTSLDDVVNDQTAVIIHSQRMDTDDKIIGDIETAQNILHIQSFETDEQGVELDSVQYVPLITDTAQNNQQPIERPKRKQYSASRWVIHGTDEISVSLGLLSMDRQFQTCYIETVIDTKSLEEKAMEQAKQIVAFYKENGIFPRENRKSVPESERKLGAFIQRLKQILRGNIAGIIYPTVKEYLDKELPGWEQKRDLEEQAMKRAKEIVAFYSEYNRFPSNKSKNIEEKKMGMIFGSWKQTYCGKGNRGVIYASVKEYLDTEIPGWSDKRDLEAKAMETAKLVVAIYREHNRLPLKSASPYEKKLKNALEDWKYSKYSSDNTNGQRKLYGSVEQYLDTEIPGWSDMRDNEAETLEKAKEVVAFYKEYGRSPRENGRNLPDIERKVGSFISRFKQILRGNIAGIIYPTVKEYLDKEIPGWEQKCDLEEKAMDHAKEAVEFYHKHNRFPNNKSTDPHEKKIGIKIQGLKDRARGNKGATLYPSVKEYLDREVPGWSQKRNLEAEAMKSAKKIVEFYRRYDKLPNSESKNVEEKNLGMILGHWKQTVRGKGNRGVIYASVKEYLDKEIPGWSDKCDKERICLELFQKIVDFRKQYNRFPRKPSNNIPEDEKKLGHKLSRWKSVIKNKKGHERIYPSVISLLKENIPKETKADNELHALLDSFDPLTHPRSSLVMNPDDDSQSVDTSTTTSTNQSIEESIEEESKTEETEESDTTLSTHSIRTVSQDEDEPESSSVVRKPRSVPVNPKPRKQTDFSKILRQNRHFTSSEWKNVVSSDKQAFLEFHRIAKERYESVSNPSEIPYRKMISVVEERRTEVDYDRDMLVVDMGCGTNEIAKYFRLRPDSRIVVEGLDVDSVSEEDGVIHKTTMQNTCLPNEYYDVVCFSLSLWGSNKDILDALKEAYRVLKPKGMIAVIEPTKKWIQDTTNERYPEKLIGYLHESGFSYTKIHSEKCRVGKQLSTYCFVNATK